MLTEFPHGQASSPSDSDVLLFKYITVCPLLVATLQEVTRSNMSHEWREWVTEAGKRGRVRQVQLSKEPALLIRVKDTGTIAQCQQVSGLLHWEGGSSGQPAC